MKNKKKENHSLEIIVVKNNDTIENKNLFIGYSLDDKDYDFIPLDKFLEINIKKNKIKIGSKYYEGLFENEKASKYCPNIDNTVLHDYLVDIEEEGFDVGEGDLIPKISKEMQEKFNEELKVLIDKYFKTNVESFISKNKKTLTKEEFDRITNIKD